MTEERIVIKIDKQGNASINVKGIKGKGCVDLTKELEESLGVVTKRDFTKEAFERPVTTTTSNLSYIRRS